MNLLTIQQEVFSQLNLTSKILVCKVNMPTEEDFHKRIVEFEIRFRRYVPRHVRKLVVMALEHCLLHNEELTSENKNNIETGIESLTLSTRVLNTFKGAHLANISVCFKIIRDSFNSFKLEDDRNTLHSIFQTTNHVQDVFRIKSPSYNVSPADSKLKELLDSNCTTRIVYDSSNKRTLHVKNETDIEELRQKIDNLKLEDTLQTLEIDIVAQDDTVTLINCHEICKKSEDNSICTTVGSAGLYISWSVDAVKNDMLQESCTDYHQSDTDETSVSSTGSVHKFGFVSCAHVLGTCGKFQGRSQPEIDLDVYEYGTNTELVVPMTCFSPIEVYFGWDSYVRELENRELNFFGHIISMNEDADIAVYMNGGKSKFSVGTVGKPIRMHTINVEDKRYEITGSYLTVDWKDGYPPFSQGCDSGSLVFFKPKCTEVFVPLGIAVCQATEGRQTFVIPFDDVDGFLNKKFDTLQTSFYYENFEHSDVQACCAKGSAHPHCCIVF